MRTKRGKMRQSVEKSIKYGINKGTLDPNRDAATLQMLRIMADMLDDNEGKTPGIKYITPASFLNYCEKLGFFPPGEAEKEPVLTLMGHSKWKKSMND